MRKEAKIKGFVREDFISFVCRQIDNVVPDNKNGRNRDLISKCLGEALVRFRICISSINLGNPNELDPYFTSQYASFLYILGNAIWKSTGDRDLPTKLFILNKALHSIDLFYEVEMPPVFLIGHAVGIVLAKATYGNYFAVFQNSTVGRFGDDVPILGDGVIMFPNTAIIGRSNVASATVVSQGTSLINTNTPGNVTVFRGNGREPIFRSGTLGVHKQLFRDIEF